MKQSINKRKLLDQEEYDLDYLQKLMSTLFPKRNDCASRDDLEEAYQELLMFGVKTKKQIRLFLKKHRKWLIQVDKEPLDAMHERIYREDLGDEEFNDCMRRHYWFCYPAFIRNAMEVEFGDAYEKFANDRDQK
jgi:hypothetical protein